MSLPSYPRLLAAVFAISMVCLSGVPAQENAPPPPTKQKDPGARLPRGFPGGFGGVTAAEAQKARILLEQGMAFEQQHKLSRALKRYKRLAKRYPRSASAPEAYYRSAQIFLAQGKITRAFESLDIVVRAYPNYGKFNELISEEYRIAYDLVKGRGVRSVPLLPKFSNRDRGIEYFERLIFNAPYSDYAPLALMNIAEQYARTNRADLAIDALDRLITNYPGSIVASDGYLRLAQIHEKLVDGPLYDQGATQESIGNYEDFLILFPTDTKVGSAEQGLERMRDMLAQSRLRIADFYYFKRARYQAAKVFYNEAITTAPNSRSAQLARERLAQVEADEARAEAKRIAAAEKPQKRGMFSFLRRSGRPQALEAPGAVPAPPVTGSSPATPPATPPVKPESKQE